MNKSTIGGQNTAKSGTDLWVFRYAVALAACIVALIVFGASLVSEMQPVPGAATPSGSLSEHQLLAQIHTGFGWAVSVLTLGLAVLLQWKERDTWLRWLGWAALAVVLADVWSGMQNALQSLTRIAGFFHAVLAQILLSIVAAIAVGACSRRRPDDLVHESGPLRSLAVAMPLLAFLQVLLGAAYRHGEMGVLMHIFNAMIVAIVVLVVCMLVIRQFPNHTMLRPSAIALGVVTGVQVALGFAAFILLLIGSGNSTALVIVSVAHVATGALTLAASVVLAMQIRQNVRPPVAPG